MSDIRDVTSSREQDLSENTGQERFPYFDIIKNRRPMKLGECPKRLFNLPINPFTTLLLFRTRGLAAMIPQ